MRQFDEEKNNSPGARFLIQILYQHNSTWQGRIIWLDAKKTMVFRSFLEMILLIKQALDQESSEVAELSERWEEREEVL